MRTLALLLLLPLAITLQAQPPATPPQTNTPQDAPLNPALPTLFIVGDSTARNKADLGWGDHFAQFFDTTRINIANRARAGRSSRSYYNEGLWAQTSSPRSSPATTSSSRWATTTAAAAPKP